MPGRADDDLLPVYAGPADGAEVPFAGFYVYLDWNGGEHERADGHCGLYAFQTDRYVCVDDLLTTCDGCGGWVLREILACRVCGEVLDDLPNY